jgi:hypothetical protein
VAFLIVVDVSSQLGFSRMTRQSCRGATGTPAAGRSMRANEKARNGKWKLRGPESAAFFISP